MTARRAHISDRTKLASALLALGVVDYEHAKAMGRDNFLSLFHFDHGILHAIEINNEFWNLTPRLIALHRVKSAIDTATVAKVKRLEKRRLGIHQAPKRKIAARRNPWPPSRKIQSRGFQKRSAKQ